MFETFKYYKRGQGELDTSNFPSILEQGVLHVDTIDSKTFVSLLAFNSWLGLQRNFINKFPVNVSGYVEHLRGDKDLYPVANIYQLLHLLDITCLQIQHESTPKIKSSIITPFMIETQLGLDESKYLQGIGCDASVSKFMVGPLPCAKKVRVNGKVLRVDLSMNSLDPEAAAIVLIDDILGGGATVQMLYDIIRKSHPDLDIYLWVQYNEGIHTDEFLSQFKGYYIGDLI